MSLLVKFTVEKWYQFHNTKFQIISKKFQKSRIIIQNN